MRKAMPEDAPPLDFANATHFGYLEMMMSVQEIIEQVKGLSPEDRQAVAHLIAELNDGLVTAAEEGELSAEESALIDAELEKYPAGDKTGVRMEDLRAHLAARRAGA